VYEGDTSLVSFTCWLLLDEFEEDYYIIFFVQNYTDSDIAFDTPLGSGTLGPLGSGEVEGNSEPVSLNAIGQALGTIYVTYAAGTQDAWDEEYPCAYWTLP